MNPATQNDSEPTSDYNPKSATDSNLKTATCNDRNFNLLVVGAYPVWLRFDGV
jgi:hypothetical protein